MAAWVAFIINTELAEIVIDVPASLITPLGDKNVFISTAEKALCGTRLDGFIPAWL